MADRLIELLRDPQGLAAARRRARDRSRDFDWYEITARTAAIYEDRLAVLRGMCTTACRHN
jgi:hypothetical protein